MFNRFLLFAYLRNCVSRTLHPDHQHLYTLLWWFAKPSWWFQKLRGGRSQFILVKFHKPIVYISPQEFDSPQPDYGTLFHPPEVSIEAVYQYDLSQQKIEPDWTNFKYSICHANGIDPFSIPPDIFYAPSFTYNAAHPLCHRITTRLLQWVESYEERQERNRRAGNAAENHPEDYVDLDWDEAAIDPAQQLPDDSESDE